MDNFWDVLAILAYFSLVIGVGMASTRRRGQNMQEFSVGSRQLPWWAVLASIVAAELSAATFFGSPGEGYSRLDFAYVQLAIGTVIARLVVAGLFIRPFYDNNVVSIYEFLEIRFGKATRNAASGVFLITRLLASGTRLYVAAIIVVLAYEMYHGTAATNEEKLWIYAIGVLVVTGLTTLYTAAGGIRAVVWTDVIQATVMGSALVYALVTLWYGVDGWTGIHAHLGANVRPGGDNDLKFYYDGFDPANAKATASGKAMLDAGHKTLAQICGILGNEYTIWTALLGSVFTTMATHGTDQDMVQRMLTAKDRNKSRLALILSGLIDVPLNLAFGLIGILIYVYYKVHTDHALPDKIPSNEVFGYYILHQLPPGARGLLIAGVLATTMGSLSTALNALATSFTRDFWSPYFGREADDSHTVRAVRWSTVVFALLLAAVAVITAAAVIMSPSRPRIIPIVLGIFGYTYGSLLGIFLLGLTTKNRGTETGNLIAMAAGFVAVAIWSGLPWDLGNALRSQSSELSGLAHIFAQLGLLKLDNGYLAPPDWLVQIEFPWRIMFGTLTTYSVAWCFRKKAVD